MIAFITSLAHTEDVPSLAVRDALLHRTLESLTAQTDDDFVVILVGDTPPHIALPRNTEFISTDFPPRGPLTDMPSLIRNKGSKLGIGLVRAKQLGAEYVMFCDFDDFVHNDIAAFVNARPGRAGWFVETGWLYSSQRNVAQRLDALYRHCGTSHIIAIDTYAVPDGLDLTATQEQVFDAYGDRIVTIIGSHPRVLEHLANRGIVLEPLPFRGSMYHVETSMNNYGRSLFGFVRPVGRRLAARYGIQPSRGIVASSASAISLRTVMEGFRVILRTIKRALKHQVAYARDVALPRWILAALGLGFSREKSASADVVLAPPGGGNIGDVAMVQACVRHFGPNVEIIVDSVHAFPMFDGVRTHVLPKLYSRSILGIIRSLRDVRKILQSAQSFSVLGADLLDGIYGVVEATRRSQLLEWSARRGTPSRAIGFSWSSTPRREAIDAILRAQAAGATFGVRDPHSRSRLAALGINRAELTADIVFTRTETAEVPERAAIADRPYALINASGLVAQSVSQRDAYLVYIADLCDRGIRPVLLPHDFRPQRDLHECQAIWDALPEAQREQSVLIDRMCDPDEIRSLTSGAVVVVTGRMHLAIMSLQMGTPALTISTNDKVEGLMELFDLPSLTIPMGQLTGRTLISRCATVLQETDDIRNRIQRALPRVRALAERNFSASASALAQQEER